MQLLGFAAFAATASAFLLPPNIASADSADLLSTVIDPKTQAISLPCSACAFPPKDAGAEDGDGGGLFWAQGGANSVVLNFSIPASGQQLDLNGVQIYPLSDHQSIEGLYVPQLSSAASLADLKNGDVRKVDLKVSGTTLQALGEEPVSRFGDRMVTIVYRIVGLENQPVTLDDVEIKLLAMADGQFMIMSVDSKPNPNDPITDIFPFPAFPLPDAEPGTHDVGKVKECKILPVSICRIIASMESKLAQMKAGIPAKLAAGGGCRGGKAGKMPGHIRPHIDIYNSDEAAHEATPSPAPLPNRPHAHFRPSYHGSPAHPHHHHHRPHHHRNHSLHRFLRSFARAFIAVVIPVCVGVMAGMAVSLIGMLVGRLVAALWIAAWRGGRRGYVAVAAGEEGGEGEGEKGEVEEEEEEEGLPGYEDVPAYVEVGGEGK
ncbi:hypothetical protein LTR66_014287 [Elasticomyces elasticus]|nr:hypothetical protein LTR66_014287 [Elasticomyces elasticus]KAK5008775.1 hypothetical protein LTR28_003524 [Elasticomyces elasticus]